MTLRISQHPILGTFAKGKPAEFIFDGRKLSGFEGEPIAMALRAAGVLVHRHTKKQNRPRGVFCAIGRCTDCVMVVDGAPNVRTCVTPLQAGMDVRTQFGFSAKPSASETGGTQPEAPRKECAEPAGSVSPGECTAEPADSVSQGECMAEPEAAKQEAPHETL